MQFEDESQVKAFLLWCRENRVLAVEAGGIKAQFAASAFYPQPTTPTKKKGDEQQDEESGLDPRTGYPLQDLFPD